MDIRLTEIQASELLALLNENLREMSHEIAATDNGHYRMQLMDRRHALEEVAASLHRRPGETSGEPGAKPLGQGSSERVWTVEIVFTEDEDRTRADARMRAAQRQWHGWGRARRNPIDPDVPAVGEELAGARALADLSHQLVEAAAHGVEAFEGHPVRLHI
jgi:Rv2632c-like